MKRLTLAVMASLGILVFVSGCAKTSYKRAALGGASPSMAAAPAPASASMTEVRADRMLIWNAHLNLEVRNVSNAVAQAVALTEQHGGFVEQKSDSGETSGSVTLRIPSKSFNAAIAGLEGLGTVTYRNVSGEDVTEQYIDIEARLKNKIVLRDRLQQLLEKATEVKDILAIETELNRVQSDIDSMEGRIKSLKGQVDYATVYLRLQRKPIPGPLGLVLKGIWWTVEKLFVIRD